MELKRSGSPMAATDSTIKRMRTAGPQCSRSACRHCGSDGHTWVGCSQQCMHCIGSHPGRRCPKLPVAVYTPGPFRLAVQDSEPPLHLERAAMIANDPPPNTSTSIEALHAPIRVESGGPERTGSNMMPLGPKQPIDTSWPTNLPTLPKKSNLPNLQKKSAIKPDQDHTYERQVRADIKQTVKSAVDATAAHSKPFIGLSDRCAVTKRVNEALDILRPIILGGIKKEMA